MMMLGRRPFFVLPFCALLLTSLLLLQTDSVNAQDDSASGPGPEAIDVQADDYEFDTETGWATGSGNVTITHRGLVLEAERVRVNMRTKDVEAFGDIYFYRLDQPDAKTEERIFWRGAELTGNFETGVFETGEHAVSVGQWYETGDKAIYRRTGEIVFHDVSVSTCEYLHSGHSHYSVNAGRVVYTSNGKLRAWNAVYKIGRIPVLYLPYMYWDTDRDGGNIEIEPGYDDEWGAFLLLSREWQIGDSGETEVGLELRSQRGVALRSHTRYRTDSSFTDVLLYGMRDQDTPETAPDFNRRFDTEEDRYRVKAYHWQEWFNSLSLRLNVDLLSDIDMLEEWFEDEFDAYPQPRTYGDLRFDHERFTLALSVRPRLNDFYTAVERNICDNNPF